MSAFRVALVYTDEGKPVPSFVTDALAAAPQDIVLDMSPCFDPSWDFADGQPPLLTPKVVEAARDADVLWVYGGAKLSADVLPLLPKLKAIIRSGSGTDNIPVGACTAHNVLVVNTPRATVDPVSDHAIALLFSLTRQVPRHAALTRSGTWDRNAAPTPFELNGTTLGFVGFGQIPRMMLRKLQHFGQKYLVYDPMLKEEDVAMEVARQGIVAPVQLIPTLHELCRRSDIVSVHAPLVDATVGLVGADAFRAMKPTSLLINTARGPVVDEEALIAALANEHHGPAAAALDVVSKEPLPASHPLTKLPNVVLTPHIGGFSEKMFVSFWELSVESIVAMARGELPESIVNPVVVPNSGFAIGARAHPRL